MKVQELVGALELKSITKVFDKDVSGVYISDMVSDIIANAKAGNLLVTVQIHNNVIAAANLVDLAAIVVTQGKLPTDDVIKMADWIIDLGPEGGDGGGQVVALGTPEEVAKVTASATGQALRHVLN